jgi:hypothetical protein
MSEPLFLIITLYADGQIHWQPETREALDWAEPLDAGPFYLSAVEQHPQIVTPESVGVTQEQLQELHALLTSPEKATNESLLQELCEQVTNAIREVRDALLAKK